ncbi:MAG TPA: hypothetical protein VKY44_05910 [Flavobacterium sp.]|nr:hypothetical protein [Flavobacterium sp.]
MKTIIPVKITMEAAHLEKIPSHKLSAIVESALNQLQKAYATELWSDDGPGKLYEAQTMLDEFSVHQEFHLEWSQPTESEGHENVPVHHSEISTSDNLHR